MPTPQTPPVPASDPREGGIPAEVFRAYDIRGIAPDPLSPELVHAVGWSIAREARELGETHVAIGRDGRLTGPRLRDALAGGLLAGGVSVVDMGQLPTPILYFAARELGSGVMITGSHNPPDYNGLKITLAGEDPVRGAHPQAPRTAGSARLAGRPPAERRIFRAAPARAPRPRARAGTETRSRAGAMVAPPSAAASPSPHTTLARTTCGTSPPDLPRPPPPGGGRRGQRHHRADRAPPPSLPRP